MSSDTSFAGNTMIVLDLMLTFYLWIFLLFSWLLSEIFCPPFLRRALQLPPEAWLRMSLDHASITWVSIRPSGLVGLQYLGDSGHLPRELVTHNT